MSVVSETSSGTLAPSYCCSRGHDTTADSGDNSGGWIRGRIRRVRGSVQVDLWSESVQAPLRAEQLVTVVCGVAVAAVGASHSPVQFGRQVDELRLGEVVTSEVGWRFRRAKIVACSECDRLIQN